MVWNVHTCLWRCFQWDPLGQILLHRLDVLVLSLQMATELSSIIDRLNPWHILCKRPIFVFILLNKWRCASFSVTPGYYLNGSCIMALKSFDITGLKNVEWFNIGALDVLQKKSNFCPWDALLHVFLGFVFGWSYISHIPNSIFLFPDINIAIFWRCKCSCMSGSQRIPHCK